MFRDGGVLPDAGGTLDQSAWLLAAWAEIDATHAREDAQRDALRKVTR